VGDDMKIIEVSLFEWARYSYYQVLPDKWKGYDEYWLTSSGSPTRLVDEKMTKKQFYRSLGTII
jgi:hypothetical protein